MANNGKIRDSSVSQQPRPKLDKDEVWAELAAKYLRDLPEQLNGIRATVQIKDYSTVKKQAHRIKGTSGTYRFYAISKSAAQLELLADSRDTDVILTTVNRVMRLVELQIKRLNSQLPSSTSSSERNTNV